VNRGKEGEAVSAEPGAPAPIGITVEFPRGVGAPVPAFVSYCMVHRLPEYVLLDLGSLDPLTMEPAEGGQRAYLQHVGRVCMPEGVARRLLRDLAAALGEG
jgi:hypothetical protein